MNTTSVNLALLTENRFQWQDIVDHLASRQIQAGDIEKFERLAVASNYALNQIQRMPELIDRLLGLKNFTLDPEIIYPAAGEKVDLDHVKQQLRLYRHQKLVEIIYLDVVSSNPLENTLRHLSELADQLIREALNACQQHLSTKHGQPLEDSGAAMELNIIAMGKLGGHELNFSSDIDLICCYDSDGELSGYGQLSYQEYFSRLVRLLNQTLSDVTADGFAHSFNS